jgi:acylphosphatase
VKRQYLVSGRVQGVGFRAFVFRMASGLGLTGFCRNLADGRVEVVAEGEETAMLSLERGLERGPRLAHVSSVEKNDILHEIASHNSFSIM